MPFYRLIFLLTYLALGSAYAQEHVVDSLITEMNKLRGGERKVKLLHRIVSSTWDYSFERAFQYAEMELSLANQLGDAESKTIAFTDLGMYYYFVGDYDEAQRQYQEALKAAGNNNFGDFPAYTMTRIGNLYRVQGQYDSALMYYLKTEDLLKGYPPGIALASVYFHRGWLLQEFSKFKESLGFLYKAKNIRNQLGDSLLIAECWRVIAATHLGLSNLDSAQYYLDKVVGVARRFGDTELVILSNIDLGDYYQTRGETVSAIRAYETALDSLVKHDFKRYRALALSQIGKVFDSRSDYLKAIDNFYESLRLNEELNSRHQIALIHGYIGWVHDNLKNFQLAEEQGQLCLELMRKIKDQAGEAFALNLLGSISFDQGDFLQANKYYNLSFRLREELGLNLLASNTRYNIARTYERLGRHDEALTIYLNVLNKASELQNFRILALCNNNIGWIYTLKHDFVNAEKYLKQGQELSLKWGKAIDVRDNYYNYGRLYKLSGKAQKANEYFEKVIIANDSILIKENSLAAQQRDALYQLERKNQEIKKLNERNQLREQEIELHKNQIFFQKVTLVLIFLALVLISLVAVILYRFNQSKAKANEELYRLNKSILEQKEEIQAQAKELTDANQTIYEINKGLEASIEERTQQLKQAFNELDTFIYRSSHDLRRPLTTFMGLAEVARISVKDNMAIELFDKVSETAHNLDSMLAKLQAVSQIASSELVAREISFDMELDFILEEHRESIQEKRIEIDRQTRITKPLISYPSLIRIILDNLIENSLTFCSLDSPIIIVLVEQVGDFVEIKISDNGEGIKKELIGRLFEMYFRANERSKGNGLGLYLVKKATEKLKGVVNYSPNPQYGSTFTVTIPYLEG